MAILKQISELEVVEKNDNMNVLVEDSGAFRKISMSNMGGGSNGNIFVIDEIAGDSVTYRANMSYQELYNLVQNHGIFCAFKRYLSGTCIDFDFFVEIFYEPDSDFIALVTQFDMDHASGHASQYEFYSDGTIIYNDSPGIGGGGLGGY